MLNELTLLERERLLKLASSLNFKRKVSAFSPIVAVERGDRLPLSFAQQRLWFLTQLEGGSGAYHIPFGLRLKGDLDGAALRRALDRIVARHESLRTTFALIDGEPVQRIAPLEESRFHLVEHDLRVKRGDTSQELLRLAAEEAGTSFDLEAGPLLRGRLIRLADVEHALLITMHHIVSDGWSMGIFRNELSTLYGAFLRGEVDPLPELEIQYADYAVWQREWMDGEILQQQAAYWKGARAGAPTLLEVPWDHPRPAQQDFRRHCFSGTERAADGRFEGAEPAAWNDVVHDPAGRMGGVADAALGPARCGDRHADGESRARRDRKPDRLLRQHPGPAAGSVRLADSGRASSQSQGTGSGGAAASGYSFRAGGGACSSRCAVSPTAPCFRSCLYGRTAFRKRSN